MLDFDKTCWLQSFQSLNFQTADVFSNLDDQIAADLMSKSQEVSLNGSVVFVGTET